MRYGIVHSQFLPATKETPWYSRGLSFSQHRRVTIRQERPALVSRLTVIPDGGAAKHPDVPFRIPLDASIADKLRRKGEEMVARADAAEAFLHSR
jgi:hypothetical protein